MIRPLDRLWNQRRLLLAAGDTAIFFAVLATTLALRTPEMLGLDLILVFLPVLGCTLTAAYAAGVYDMHVMQRVGALVSGLGGSAAATLALSGIYFYVLSPYTPFSPKLTLLLLVVGSHAGMLVWRRSVLLGRKDFNLLHLRIMVLADESSITYLRGSFGRRSSDDIKFLAGPTLGRAVNLVVVHRSWTDSHAEQARAVMTAAIGRQIPIISIGEFHESMCGRVSPQDANDLGWALDNVLPRFGGSYFKAKRVVDVLVAVPLLVLLGPMILAVALAVLMDGGSPFYAQRRVGYLGRSFLLWKFRSMRQGADRAGPFIQTAEEGDDRVTRLGALLRRFRIDELPQLWNVVKGDMSLVGPRPEWIKEVEILEHALPTYSLRYLVPPGITGWAQVLYRATNSPEAGREKHHYDLYYLKHFSLALDVSIVLKTIKRVVSKERRTYARSANEKCFR